jgi:hypothetical protein
VGRIAAFVTVIVLAGSLWYGHAPPRSAGAYRRQAVTTVDLLSSQVNTARLWIREVRDGRVTRPAASVAFREAEDDARATAERFAGYDSAGSGDLRERVQPVAEDAVEALAAVRIATHGGDWQRLGDLDGGLSQVGRRLAELGRELG